MKRFRQFFSKRKNRDQINRVVLTLGILSLFSLLYTVPMPERNYTVVRKAAGLVDRIFGRGTSTPFLPDALRFAVDWSCEGGFFFLDEPGSEKVRKATGLVVNPLEESKKMQEIEKAIFERAGSLKEMSAYRAKVIPSYDFPYVVFLDEKESPRGIYFETDGVTPDIRGFGGPLHLGVLLNEEGIILKTVHVFSNETPAYLRMLERNRFFEQISDMDINRGNHTIDAVTGATVSSRAVAETVTEASDRISESVLKNYIPVDGVHRFRIEAGRSPVWIVYFILFLLLFLVGRTAFFRKSSRIRKAVYILSILSIGIWINGSVTFTVLLNPFLGSELSLLGGLTLLFAILASVWGKNDYCGHVCPYGNAQRFVASFSPLARRGFFLSRRTLSRIRIGVLFLLGAGILSGYQEWTAFEPFPYLFAPDPVSAWFWFSLVFLLLSMRYPLLWCRAACPTGAFLDTRTIKPFRVNKGLTTPESVISIDSRSQNLQE